MFAYLLSCGKNVHSLIYSACLQRPLCTPGQNDDDTWAQCLPSGSPQPHREMSTMQEDVGTVRPHRGILGPLNWTGKGVVGGSREGLAQEDNR